MCVPFWKIAGAKGGFTFRSICEESKSYSYVSLRRLINDSRWRELLTRVLLSFEWRFIRGIHQKGCFARISTKNLLKIRGQGHQLWSSARKGATWFDFTKTEMNVKGYTRWNSSSNETIILIHSSSRDSDWGLKMRENCEKLLLMAVCTRKKPSIWTILEIPPPPHRNF